MPAYSTYSIPWYVNIEALSLVYSHHDVITILTSWEEVAMVIPMHWDVQHTANTDNTTS